METVQYKGYTIEIEQDDFAVNPLEDWDGNVKYALFHKRYKLQNDTDLHTPDYNSWGEFEKVLIKKYKTLAILPIYMYDHSNITINTTGFSCRWDSGQIGFAFINKECLKEWGYKSRKGYEKATKCTLEEDIISNVELYADYLSGSVYMFNIKDLNGEDVNNCAGFYGYDHEKSGLLEHARSSIDGEISWSLKERLNKLKNLILNKTPLDKRQLLLN